MTKKGCFECGNEVYCQHCGCHLGYDAPVSVREAARVLLGDSVAFRTMATAARRSRAKCDEGEHPPLFDLLGFSGENKTKIVVDAAITAALRAIAEGKDHG